jgi:uncharacterized membrane protein YvbJ
MIFSVCINCGSEKTRPSKRCTKCGFKPQSDDDKAKSLILSTAYEINGEYRGKTKKELKAIADEIRKGRQHEFSKGEVQSIIEYAQQVMAISTWRLIIDGLKWIGPPFAILLLVYLFLFMQ